MGEKKTRVRSVRFDDADYAAIQAAAAAAGVTFGTYVRNRALQGAPSAPVAQPVDAAPVEQPAPPPPAQAKPPAPRPRIYALDAVGPDPFRGGHMSSRR